MQKIFGAVFFCMFLTGCENINQTIGTVAGGAGGAALGSMIGKGRGKMISTGAFAVLGALMGSHVGAMLDKKDKEAAAQATCDALENGCSGETIAWSNPDSGHMGSVTPAPSQRDSSGRICRPFKQVVCIDGKETVINGMAYRDGNGQWHMAN